MKRFAIALAVLAAGVARAEDAAWKFIEGGVLNYEASTVVEWSVAFPAGGPAPARAVQQRQEESVKIRLEILKVDAEGTAQIEGSFLSVRVENTAPAGKVSWDSTKSKTTEFLGFKRYEALLSVKFTATVAADGRVLETTNAGTPDPAPTANTAKEHVEAAALDMHHPTTPRAWLDMIFLSTPPAKNKTLRTLRFIEAESLEFKFDRYEQKNGRAAAKISFDTPDRDSSIREDAVLGFQFADANAIAWGALRIGRKNGEAWFDRKDGALLRFEADSDVTVAWSLGSTSARMTWEIDVIPHPARKK